MRLINGIDYDIPMTPELTTHFADPYNYTREIMDQFDHGYYTDIVPKHCRTMLDIGANIGLFALHVHPYITDRLICVEPTPSHMVLQRELLKLPVIQDGKFRGIKQLRVEHEESALSNRTGETTFYWCGINTTMNSLQPRGDKSMTVKCLTIEDLLLKYALNTVDFVKIDIEGSEDTAITVETLHPVAERLHKVFIELHPPNGESQERFTAIFKEVGYQVEKYVHDSLICTHIL